MKLALVCLEQDLSDPPAGRICPEAAQALAIARNMQTGDELEPCLIGMARSGLIRKAIKYDLPVLALNGNFADLARLWSWQRKCPRIMVLLVGQNALPIAKNLLVLRGKKFMRLSAAFFVHAPLLDAPGQKLFFSLTHCLCGSEYIRGQISAALRGKSSGKQALPQLRVIPPGIDTEEYRNVGLVHDQQPDVSAGRHFVFGMNSSLLPHSGARLVVRAMTILMRQQGLPPWEVHMFGAGPRYEEVLAEAQKTGAAARLIIMTGQPLKEMTCRCHAWLAPGSAAEEDPETLYAGFAAGLPVICSRSALHLERLRIFSNNVAKGFAVNNAEELAAAMQAVLVNQSLRNSLVAGGREVVRQSDLEYMARRVRGFIEDWLSGRDKNRDILDVSGTTDSNDL